VSRRNSVLAWATSTCDLNEFRDKLTRYTKSRFNRNANDNVRHTPNSYKVRQGIPSFQIYQWFEWEMFAIVRPHDAT
jgi:hypothetical protein